MAVARKQNMANTKGLTLIAEGGAFIKKIKQAPNNKMSIALTKKGPKSKKTGKAFGLEKKEVNPNSWGSLPTLK